MALGNTDINTTNVGTEIGSASDTWSGLVGNTSLNKYSRYGPGQLDVDANKDIILTPVTSNYKMGDFRSYNHSAIAHNMDTPDDGYIAWGPSGTVASYMIGANLNDLNIMAFSTQGGNNMNGTFMLRARAYADNANMNADTNVLVSQNNTISMTAHTPMSGHTRQVYWVPATGYSTNRIDMINIPVDAGNCNRSFDLFIADPTTGAKRINIGKQVVEFRQRQDPKIYTGPYYTPNPTGFTGVWPAISTASGVCATNNPITLTQGSNNANFYIRMRGVLSGSQYMVNVNSADILLQINNNSSNRITLATGVAMNTTTNNTGYSVGNADVGRAWTWFDYVQPIFTNVTYGNNSNAQGPC